nr:uncharacterized protein LOC114082049 isoform X1 [Marmota flaviventris]
MMGRFERDAFDTLFDHAPDKLNLVKKSLITFVNKQLTKLNLEVTELETQVLGTRTPTCLFWERVQLSTPSEAAPHAVTRLCTCTSLGSDVLRWRPLLSPVAL